MIKQQGLKELLKEHNISALTLKKDNVYLLEVDVGDLNAQVVRTFCENLHQMLLDNGIKCVIIPITNGLNKIHGYKLSSKKRKGHN